MSHFPRLCSLSTDPTCELNILRHDGDALGMDGTQVRILKQPNEIGLSCLLQRKNSGRLESKVVLEVLCDLTNQSLEWQLAQEEVSGLLIASNLTQCNGTRSISVWLLHASCCWCRLTCGLRRQLLTWRLTTCRLTRGLLRTRHDGNAR